MQKQTPGSGLFRKLVPFFIAASAIHTPVHGENLVTNGTFAQGNSAFTSNATYVPDPIPLTSQGVYSVRSDAMAAHSAWCGFDRTPVAGLFLLCNGKAGSPTISWRQTIPVTPGEKYVFSAWVNNLVCNPGGAEDDPVMELHVDGTPVAGPLQLPVAPDAWTLLSGSFTAASSSAILEIVSTSVSSNGNDFGVDDISVCPASESPCSTTPFLKLPLCRAADFDGQNCASHREEIASWPITAVVDHSGSYTQENGEVKAFTTDLNCTMGAPCIAREAFGNNPPPSGYRLDCEGTPISFHGIINYIGVDGGNAGQCESTTGITGATSYLNYDRHSGYDLDTSFGDVILAAESGTLDFPPSTDNILGNPSDLNALRIRHSNGLETWYLHSQRGSECTLGGLCSVGQTVEVEAGQAIALAGNTGLGCGDCSPTGCCRDHLHFEVRMTAAPTDVVDPFGCDSDVRVADEARCLLGRLWFDFQIFMDGFETGNTSAWSTQVP